MLSDLLCQATECSLRDSLYSSRRDITGLLNYCPDLSSAEITFCFMVKDIPLVIPPTACTKQQCSLRDDGLSN